MKIQLGSIEIDTDRVSYISRVGSRLCRIGFATGNAILVTCGVDSKDGLISFKGNTEQLRMLIENN